MEGINIPARIVEGLVRLGKERANEVEVLVSATTAKKELMKSGVKGICDHG
jgi:hypothetical protein